MRNSKPIDPFASTLWLTRTAASFAQRHPSVIARAARNGELPIAGKNGRSFVFRREDVERWMLGGTATEQSTTEPRRAASALSGDALARIERARRGEGSR